AEDGGTATVTATLSMASPVDVTVTLGYGGTAAPGKDFTAPPQIVIPAGSLTGSVTPTGLPDRPIEGDELVVVSVKAVTNATVAGNQQVAVPLTDSSPLPLQVKRIRAAGRHRLVLIGLLPLGDGLDLAGIKVTVRVGRVVRTFVLDAHGRGRSRSAR